MRDERRSNDTVRPLLRMICLAVVASSATACGAAAPSDAPGPTPIPAATSFDEYAVAFCSAWDSLFLAVGNPDTGGGSELSMALDAAVVARDGLAAERLAAEIIADLESGRRFAAAAGGWSPAEAVMAQMDRLFVAFEAMASAKAAVAAEVPNALEPQAAFEQAGGLDAWTGTLLAAQAMARPPGLTSKPCPNVPISP